MFEGLILTSINIELGWLILLIATNFFVVGFVSFIIWLVFATLDWTYWERHKKDIKTEEDNKCPYFIDKDPK